MHGDVFKDGSRNSDTLRWSFLNELVTVKSCQVLQLMHNKIVGSAPDFYISHHYMRSILTLNIIMKNKQIFNTHQNRLSF